MSVIVAILMWYNGAVHTCTAPDANELMLTRLTSCHSVIELREGLEVAPEGDVVL